MNQRVMIAMAIACRPKLLIADEPTTALDVTIQAQILDLLLKLQAETGMALVLITHDMGVVAETAHRVVVQYAGQQVERAGGARPVREPASSLHRRAARCACPTAPSRAAAARPSPASCPARATARRLPVHAALPLRRDRDPRRQAPAPIGPALVQSTALGRRSAIQAAAPHPRGADA